VYLSGAQITRTETFKLKEGTNKILFKDLPLNINGQSISASSDGKCAVLSVSYSNIYAKTENKRISDLHARLEKLTDELEITQRKFNVLTEEEELIRVNTRASDKKIFRSEDMKDAVAFFRERMAALCSEKFALQKEIKELNRKISDIRSEIGADEMERRRSQVEIEVHCKSDTDSELTISYFIHSARWAPYYDIRVKDVEGPVSIASKATVYQNTGEDWNNVNIILSTGNPSLSGSAPDLDPWYIDFYEPIAPAVRRKEMSFQTFNAAAAEKLAEPCLDECREDSMMVMDEYIAKPTESVTSVEYALAVPYTVLSSNNGKSVDILTHEVKAEYIYKSVRKLEKDVFLIADVKDWEHLNLLAGNANIFFEDKYVGETYIDPRKAGESLHISLGRDKNIIVTRIRGKDFTAKAGIGSSVKASREWVLTVKNLRKQKIDIVVEDQIPVSVNKSITVDAVTVSGAEYDKEKGKLEWKLALAPAESRSFNVKYTVTYPKNKTVILE
jgi:uncharacterized protein (TIGR02231 family)